MTPCIPPAAPWPQRLLLALALLGLFACNRPEVVRTVEVKIPVPVPAPVPPRLERPKPPAVLLDPHATDRAKAQALVAWIHLLQAYAAALELQLEALRSTSAPLPEAR